MALHAETGVDHSLGKETFMFKLGNEYTRDEIHAQLGGSTWSYLPTNRGVVVAARTDGRPA